MDLKAEVASTFISRKQPKALKTPSYGEIVILAKEQSNPGRLSWPPRINKKGKALQTKQRATLLPPLLLSSSHLAESPSFREYFGTLKICAEDTT